MKKFKKIQVSLPEDKYEDFHKQAVEIFGDNRYADAALIRECIKPKKRKTRAEKEKLISLVYMQENINRYRRGEHDDAKALIKEIGREMNDLWQR